jgi:hypothetical protein
MKKLKRVASIATLIMMFFGRAYAAQLININLITDGGAAMTGAAAIGTAGDIWNESPVGSLTDFNDMVGIDPNTTPFNLVNSSGLDSGVTLDAFFFGTSNLSSTSFVDGAGKQLMQGYVLGSGYMTLSGLGANQSYVLYVYSQAETGVANTSSTLTAGSVSFDTPINNGNASTFIKGVNYTSHIVTADSAGSLTVTVSTLNANSAINGFQIQAVPEPKSVMLLGVGGVLVFAYFRLKSNESTL